MEKIIKYFVPPPFKGENGAGFIEFSYDRSEGNKYIKY